MDASAASFPCTDGTVGWSEARILNPLSDPSFGPCQDQRETQVSPSHHLLSGFPVCDARTETLFPDTARAAGQQHPSAPPPGRPARLDPRGPDQTSGWNARGTRSPRCRRRVAPPGVLASFVRGPARSQRSISDVMPKRPQVVSMALWPWPCRFTLSQRIEMVRPDGGLGAYRCIDSSLAGRAEPMIRSGRT